MPYALLPELYLALVGLLFIDSLVDWLPVLFGILVGCYLLVGWIPLDYTVVIWLRIVGRLQLPITDCPWLRCVTGVVDCLPRLDVLVGRIHCHILVGCPLVVLLLDLTFATLNYPLPRRVTTLLPHCRTFGLLAGAFRSASW